MLSTTTFRCSLATALLAVGVTGSAWAENEPADVPQSPPPVQLPFDLPKLPAEDAGSSSAPPSAAPLAAVSKPPPALPGGGAAQGAPEILEDIRDIRGPMAITPSWRWAWLSLAGLVEVGLLAMLWHRLRRRGRVRARRAYEIAFDQLEQARLLMRPEQARAFSFLVSETIREYIDQRYAVGITHCTTQEFAKTLMQGPPNPLQAHGQHLQEFLWHCDLAKFARWSLSIEQMQAMHQSAWQFVTDTRPQPEKTTRATVRHPAQVAREPMPILVAAGGPS